MTSTSFDNEVSFFKVLSIVEGEEPLPLGSKVNITLFVKNSKLSRAVWNVSFSEPIPNQMKVNSTSSLDSISESSLEEAWSINQTWFSINPGEEVSFWILLELINTTKSVIRFNEARVDYLLDEYGSWGRSYSNYLSLRISQSETTTTSTQESVVFSLLPPAIHDLTFPAIVLIIMIPLIGISFTYFILRRIKF